jgi:uracil-DNA glycosylase family 4
VKGDINMLKDLLDEMLACRRCSFASDLNPPLTPARLRDNAKIMFVGENPSWEFGQRIPFDGITHSGRALHDNYVVPLQKAYGLNESDFWITDLLKCRYPKTIYREKAQRQPEILSCAQTCATSWLVKEIEFLKPVMIVTLGDKEVYQRLREVFSLSIEPKFQNAAYRVQQVSIGSHNCALLAACHPDISFNNQRKPAPSRKWSTLHRSRFVKSFKEVLSRGGA